MPTDFPGGQPPLESPYAAPREHAALVDVPDAEYAMLEGTESPYSSTTFQTCIDTLLAIGEAVRRHSALESPAHIDPPAPVEAVWRWDHGAGAWTWTLMMRHPSDVPPHVLARALREVASGGRAEFVRRTRFATYHEGRAMQILHVGPYNREMDTIRHLFDEIENEGYLPKGPVHEIYLSDPVITPPERWETIIRQPVSGPGHLLD